MFRSVLGDLSAASRKTLDNRVAIHYYIDEFLYLSLSIGLHKTTRKNFLSPSGERTKVRGKTEENNKSPPHPYPLPKGEREKDKKVRGQGFHIGPLKERGQREDSSEIVF